MNGPRRRHCILGATFGVLGALSQAGAAPAQQVEPPGSHGQSGLNLAVTYYGDALANTAGGLGVGTAYQGRLGVILDADLERLTGWTGAAAHLSVHQIHGQEPTTHYVGALMTVSGIEAEPATRLFNLWIEQKFGDRWAVRVGQFTAAQEFLISPNAALFVNATFGWPALPAQDLPSGGPAYPLATPGVRLTYKPDSKTTMLAAVFNGDPAGPGGGDPQQRDRNGFNAFRLSGKPFLIAEAQHAFGPPSQGDPDLMIRLGAWAYLGDVADQRWDREGRLLADPLSSGVPAQRSRDWGVYGVLDKVLSRRDGGGLNLFLRGAVGPSDRNLIEAYADAGITYKGLVSGRPDDVAGVAIAWARISDVARAHDADIRRFALGATPIRDYEIAVEASYQAQVTARWSVQPDLQYIAHPGGGAPSPDAPNRTVGDAVVVGVRNVFKF